MLEKVIQAIDLKSDHGIIRTAVEELAKES